MSTRLYELVETAYLQCGYRYEDDVPCSEIFLITDCLETCLGLDQGTIFDSASRGIAKTFVDENPTLTLTKEDYVKFISDFCDLEKLDHPYFKREFSSIPLKSFATLKSEADDVYLDESKDSESHLEDEISYRDQLIESLQLENQKLHHKVSQQSIQLESLTSENLEVTQQIGYIEQKLQQVTREPKTEDNINNSILRIESRFSVLGENLKHSQRQSFHELRTVGKLDQSAETLQTKLGMLQSQLQYLFQEFQTVQSKVGSISSCASDSSMSDSSIITLESQYQELALHLDLIELRATALDEKLKSSDVQEFSDEENENENEKKRPRRRLRASNIPIFNEQKRPLRKLLRSVKSMQALKRPRPKLKHQTSEMFSATFQFSLKPLRQETVNTPRLHRKVSLQDELGDFYFSNDSVNLTPEGSDYSSNFQTITRSQLDYDQLNLEPISLEREQITDTSFDADISQLLVSESLTQETSEEVGKDIFTLLYELWQYLVVQLLWLKFGKVKAD